MNFNFCLCGREHKWPHGSKAVCRCGAVLEAQTKAEYDERKQTHEAVLERIATALASADDLEPTIRFFRD
jgi:hypothetical protein